MLRVAIYEGPGLAFSGVSRSLQWIYNPLANISTNNIGKDGDELQKRLPWHVFLDHVSFAHKAAMEHPRQPMWCETASNGKGASNIRDKNRQSANATTEPILNMMARLCLNRIPTNPRSSASFKLHLASFLGAEAWSGVSMGLLSVVGLKGQGLGDEPTLQDQAARLPRARFRLD